MSEYTAMVNIYNEYADQLEMGFLNPDEGIPEMVRAPEGIWSGKVHGRKTGAAGRLGRGKRHLLIPKGH